MEKFLLFFILFTLFFCCNTYADDSLLDNGIFEGLPGPPGLSEKPVKFEPDPDDTDGDRLSNADEEKYGTDPYDPDTDDDGMTDFFEVTNGTDPTIPNSIGYLEVIDLEKGNKPVPPSDDNNDKIDKDYLNILPGNINETTPDNPDEYEEYVPPDAGIDFDPIPPPWDDISDKDNIDKQNDRSENNKEAGLNRSSTGFDLTPIFMLLLLDEDSDSDGLLDTWEMEHFGSLSYDAEDDPDQDNLSNLGEYNNHTDPNNPDTDGDGLTDGFEVLNGLNPNSIDTDSDGLNDGYEVSNNLDPLDPDMDDDGLLDGAEIAAGTDPQNSDTDHDDLPDYWEVNSGTNPVVYDRDNDLDSDLYTNYIEYILDTDPDNINSSPIPGFHHKYDDKGRLISSIALKNYQIEYDIRYAYDMAGNRSIKLIR
ncbi:MAG: hypothetical protein JW927_19640 [Deltaproteobacteria bacterium]|nr:hypothetical protein [Deltaproteobacteria bacterium]